jgi:multidrug efflux pump subunit AcrA (membrane-fusion protein)
LVSDAAIGSDQGGRYVLVVNKDDNVIEKRKVEPGQLVGELRVIEKGLTRDDHVVVGGIMRLSPGQRSSQNCTRSRRRTSDARSFEECLDE